MNMIESCGHGSVFVWPEILCHTWIQHTSGCLKMQHNRRPSLQMFHNKRWYWKIPQKSINYPCIINGLFMQNIHFYLPSTPTYWAHKSNEWRPHSKRLSFFSCHWLFFKVSGVCLHSRWHYYFLKPSDISCILYRYKSCANVVNIHAILVTQWTIN